MKRVVGFALFGIAIGLVIAMLFAQYICNCSVCHTMPAGWI